MRMERHSGKTRTGLLRKMKWVICPSLPKWPWFQQWHTCTENIWDAFPVLQSSLLPSLMRIVDHCRKGRPAQLCFLEDVTLDFRAASPQQGRIAIVRIRWLSGTRMGEEMLSIGHCLGRESARCVWGATRSFKSHLSVCWIAWSRR